MVTPNHSPSLEDQIIEELYSQQTYPFGGQQLVDAQAAPLIGYMPDLHGNGTAYAELLDHLDKRVSDGNSSRYAVIGDVDDKQTGAQLAQAYGIRSVEQELMGYLAEKLDSDSSKETFVLSEQVRQMGGPETYLSAVRQQYGEQAAKQQQQRLETLLGDERHLNKVQQELQQVVGANQEEMEQLQTQVTLRNQAFDMAVKSYVLEPVVETMVKRAREEMDTYGTIKTHHLFAPGNHDDMGTEWYIASRLTEELGEKTASELFGNVMRYDGAIVFGEGNEALRWNYSPNIALANGYDQQVKGMMQMIAANPHMYADHQAQVYDPKSGKELADQDTTQSQEYARLTRGLEGNLDVMLLHDGFGRKGLDQEILPTNNAGLYQALMDHTKKNEDGLAQVAYGHIHAPDVRKDENWGIEGHRDYAMLIGKDGIEHVSLSQAYQRPALEGFDQKRFEQTYEQFLQAFLQQYQQGQQERR